jgi:alpha-L-fucosidase
MASCSTDNPNSLEHNGASIYRTERGDFSWGTFANYTRRGNTLYIHVNYWPGQTPAAHRLSFFQPETVVAIGGLNAKVKSAKLLRTGARVGFEQYEFTVRFTCLPSDAPENPVTVLEVECDSEPAINHESIRSKWPRYSVNIE